MAFRAVLLILGLSAIASGSPKKYTHYYWRDYTGEVPCDAVVGGHDELNRTTYIGQGVALNNDYYTFSPLTIIEGDAVQRAPLWGYGMPVVQTRILCVTSPYPDKWIATNSQNLVADTVNEQLVLGGIEGSKHDDNVRYELNIGRAKVGNKLLTGKIITLDTYNSVLYVVDGWQAQEVKEFEVLVANN
ncbi:unnamed protein product [Acanthoscelides obtectus]|uniref:Uncharacterized protein n=1 Tax=Acanthoscelides obtectus TaxID=200917 RepID=A0A9P0LBM7_ACAOB|nr:unnamed protein product [Acanthoscelides obtectus]CAK1638505.1 hypothetical protein AOBTE_LOCUS10639 [Acanthoscelides obtectus]